MRQILVEIIDLEKDHLAVGFERAKVVLFIPVVGVAKIVVHRDGLDDSGDLKRESAAKNAPRGKTMRIVAMVARTAHEFNWLR
jgi:hypothetical protein